MNIQRTHKLLTGGGKFGFLARIAILSACLMFVLGHFREADALENDGVEFVLAFPDAYEFFPQDSYKLAIGARSATTATWSIPGLGIGPNNVAVPANSFTIVDVGTSAALGTSGTIEDKGILVTSPQPIVIVGIADMFLARDAYLALPSTIPGQDFVVPSFPDAVGPCGETGPCHRSSGLAVVATEDDTDVIITPSVNGLPGADTPETVAAGVAFTISLDRLQTFNLHAESAPGFDTDLTGTTIHATKPITVFGGSRCAYVPIDVEPCNHLVEQILPTQTWGTYFLTTPLKTRTAGDVFRVVASVDGTTVRVDGSAIDTIDEGEFAEFELSSSTYSSITTTAPVIVEQYSKGDNADPGATPGDPFMMTVLPVTLFATDYLVYNSQFLGEPSQQHYINIVALTTDTTGVRLDGASITSSWTAIDSLYSGVQVTVSAGSHRVTHTDAGTRFGVQVYGFRSTDAYGYPGGMDSSTPEVGGGQTFVGNDPTERFNSIDVDYCYDTNPVNAQVTVPPTPPALLPRLECNPLNPPVLPANTAVYAWTLINLPMGNRLARPVTFTPSGPNGWQYAAVPCMPVDANNECTPATQVGDFSARVDLGCNAPVFDILGNSVGADPPNMLPQTNWGNSALAGQENGSEAWPVSNFARLAASAVDAGSGAITGGDNAYIHAAVPFPVAAPNAWTFRTSDLTLLDTAYLSPGTGLTIPPTKLNQVAYASSYPGQTGLVASISLLGESTESPPDDNLTMCALQAPMDSFNESLTLITPNVTRRIVRWTTLQSDFNRADASGPNFEEGDLTRILDWQCTLIGPSVEAVNEDGGDDDGDCDPNPMDANPVNIDNDGDLVPDGVERAYNSNPNDPDTDNDNCNDYCEIFNYTDPTDTDSDNDGQADKPDETPTNCAPGGAAFCGGDDLPSTGSDAMNLTDDNCPAVFNPSQLNTDSMYQFHGMGFGTGDATNPDEDVEGDACDTDDDNDGLPGTTEALLRIARFGGYLVPPPGEATAICVGVTFPDTALPDEPLLDTRGDTDMDYVLDGAECQFRSRPDQSIRGECPIGSWPSTGTCASAARNCNLPLDNGFTDDEGCAQPQNAAGVEDGAPPAKDGLYLPGGPNARVESQFRSDCFNGPTLFCVLEVDGDPGPCGPGGPGACDRDSDRDTLGLTGTAANLQDGVEVWIYGTFPADTDTDQDGCPDGDEVNDINGDGTNNSGDQGLWASRFIALGANLDNNGDGRVDDYALGVNFDVNKSNLYQLNSGDQGLMAATQVAPGSCQVAGSFVEDNVDVGSLLNLP